MDLIAVDLPTVTCRECGSVGDHLLLCVREENLSLPPHAHFACKTGHSFFTVEASLITQG